VSKYNSEITLPNGRIVIKNKDKDKKSGIYVTDSEQNLIELGLDIADNLDKARRSTNR